MKVLLLITGLALGLAACSDAGPSPSPPPRDRDEQAPVRATREARREASPRTASGPRILLLDETVSSGDTRFTVHGFRETTEERGQAAREGHMWVVMEMTAENKGRQPYPLHLELIDPYGHLFDKAFDILFDFVEETLHPGPEVRGELAFEVPQNGLPHAFLFGPGEPLWAIEISMYRGRGD
jgi:hypothetical protein